MILATDFYSEEDYYAALDERVATDAEAVVEFAANIGWDFPDRAWLLDDRDVWVRNPHYAGPAVRHPEDDYDEEVGAMATFQTTRNIQCRDEDGMIGYAEVKLELNVDTEDIFKFLGNKALRNTTKKAKEISGAVVVSVIRDIPKGWKRTGY